VRGGEARWEERVQRAAHPVAYPAVRSLRGRPVVRVPRVGLMVNDAAIAREVLLDVEHFSKVGPGSPSDLWTPILGPSVLLNMEGAEHDVWAVNTDFEYHEEQRLEAELRGAEALVIVTEWDALRALDLPRLRSVMSGDGLVDLRNIYRPEVAEAAGFAYVSVGRGSAPQPEPLIQAAE
jgi:hypothetical protein